MDELLHKPQLISSINYANWGIGLILLILFTLVFQYIFKRFALIASNRRLFASHFLYYSISIFLIITTIKSSLALSLGLVGALSIIRFRTAIKEPEQIIFLLALTAVSIALAAEQFLLSTFTVLIFTAIAIIRNQQYKKHQYIAQDFLLIQFHASAPLASPGILEDLLHINGISQLNLYENNNGNYRLLYQLDQADLALISAVEHKLASLQLEQLSVKISQSLV